MKSPTSSDGFTNYQSPVESKLRTVLKLHDLQNLDGVIEVMVTPEMAAQILKMNTNNRRVRDKVVTRYATDMVFNRWKRGTYELVKISKSGVVSDGQHRLHAVIKSKQSVYFHFKLNIDDDVFDVLDTGSVRNASDVFKIEGIKHENILPSMIQSYWRLSSGYTSMHNTKLTNHQVLQEYEGNSDFWQEAARKTCNWYSAFKGFLSPSLIGGFYTHFYSKDALSADRFMTELCTGMSHNTTIQQLRNKLIGDDKAKRKMSMYEKLALVIRAWNYFRSNRQMKILKFDVQRDDFPVAI